MATTNKTTQVRLSTHVAADARQVAAYLGFRIQRGQGMGEGNIAKMLEALVEKVRERPETVEVLAALLKRNTPYLDNK